MLTITALNIYPVKSCRGTALDRATLAATGLEHDREWMVVDANGRFLTQRTNPPMALIAPELHEDHLVLTAPSMQPLRVSLDSGAKPVSVKPVSVIVWRDKCAAFDAGDEAAEWLSAFLQRPCRLVRFDTGQRRFSDPAWTGELKAHTFFADGFPLLVISEASLDDLNRRLPAGVGPLPMNRFRPNIVVRGLDAYEEDAVDEFLSEGVRLRASKPCTRCAITTTDQARGVVTGEEPLRTLRAYRFSRELKGVMLGQNVVIAGGTGAELRVGQTLTATWKHKG
jgi:uncharacterized protein